ncbi:hypothetical protein DYB30_006459, partial [Aphanomyces astaci]
MTTQPTDCSVCDFRIAKVPQKTHAVGSTRHLILPRGSYPRYDEEGEVALVAHLTAASNKFATSAHEAFYALFVDVVTRFHDGSIFSDFASESMTVSAMGYPS